MKLNIMPTGFPTIRRPSPMLRRLILLILLQLSLSASEYECAAGTDADTERLAVLPFELRGMSADNGLRLQQKFCEILAESKRFDVMPDNVLKDNLKRSGVSDMDTCNTQACLAQLGKILNVEKIVHISVDERKERYVLHVRLVRSSDAALLYDERVDYSGEFSNLLSTVAPEQAQKLNSAFLDKKPNWYLIAATLIVGIGLIWWIFSLFASKSTINREHSNPTSHP